MAPVTSAGSPIADDSFPGSTASVATRLSIVSALSPLLGLLAEIVLAWRFGTTEAMDAFRLALTVPLLTYQVLVLQILPNVVVPTLASYRARGREAEGWRTVLALGRLLAGIGVLASVALFAGAAAVAEWLGPGLSPEARDATAWALRWFAWALGPIAWTGIAAGLLYARGTFWPPMAAQVVSNASLIVGAMVTPVEPGLSQVVGAVVASSLLNAAWISALLMRADLRRRCEGARRLAPWDRAVFASLRPAVPIFGTLVLTQMLVAFFLRRLSDFPTGTLAVFGYAWKLQQLSTFLPTVLATVLFPRFAEGLASGDSKRIGTTFQGALRMAWFLAIPVACVAFLWRLEIIQVLFVRGRFSEADAAACAALFACLLAAMPAVVARTYLQQFLLAGLHGWWATLAQMVTLTALVIGCTALGANADARSLTVVLASATWLGTASLVPPTLRLAPTALSSSLLRFALETLALALVAGSSARFVFTTFAPDPNGFWAPILGLSGGGILAFALYLCLSRALGWSEADQLLRSVSARRRSFLRLGSAAGPVRR